MKLKATEYKGIFPSWVLLVSLYDFLLDGVKDPTSDSFPKVIFDISNLFSLSLSLGHLLLFYSHESLMQQQVFVRMCNNQSLKDIFVIQSKYIQSKYKVKK